MIKFVFFQISMFCFDFSLELDEVSEQNNAMFSYIENQQSTPDFRTDYLRRRVTITQTLMKTPEKCSVLLRLIPSLEITRVMVMLARRRRIRRILLLLLLLVVCFYIRVAGFRW